VPVYSVNRRRAILLLILSSVLLLTLDLRGNPLFDRARTAFARVLDPFETAANVVATPIRNAWHGVVDYPDLKRENEALRDQLAAQRGAELAARAVVYDYLELAALNGLVVNYPRVTARVVGGAPGNFEQTIEIDRGRADGVRVGAPVISPAGLVGRITKAYADRSIVRLITDAEYAIECKVSAVPADAAVVSGGDASAGDDGSTTTEGTTPSGASRDDLETTTTTTTAPQSSTSTTSTTKPDGSGGGDQGAAGTAGGTSTTGVGGTTTTTLPLAPQEREVGGCEGRGSDRLPAMRFVTENPAFGAFGVGDIITTTGGSSSLAPPGLIIGEVINVVARPGSAGPLLEIDLAADLDHLNFVQVLKFSPPTEVPTDN
jgi:rod shape-determining protein MreC